MSRRRGIGARFLARRAGAIVSWGFIVLESTVGDDTLTVLGELGLSVLVDLLLREVVGAGASCEVRQLRGCTEVPE